MRRTIVLAAAALAAAGASAQAPFATAAAGDTAPARLAWGTINVLVFGNRPGGVEVWARISPIDRPNPRFHFFMDEVFAPADARAWVRAARPLAERSEPDAVAADSAAWSNPPVLTNPVGAVVGLMRSRQGDGWAGERYLVLMSAGQADTLVITMKRDHAIAFLDSLDARAARSGPVARDSGAAFAGLPSTPVMMNHPALVYPPRMVDRGIEGVALVEFVVDTAGGVDLKSAHVLFADDPDFGASALNMLAASRFAPGMLGGHAVRVATRMEFWFSER